MWGCYNRIGLMWEGRHYSDVHDFYRNVCAAIDGRETQYVTHPEMRKVLRCMELAFRSAELDQTIDWED